MRLAISRATSFIAVREHVRLLVHRSRAPRDDSERVSVEAASFRTSPTRDVFLCFLRELTFLPALFPSARKRRSGTRWGMRRGTDPVPTRSRPRCHSLCRQSSSCRTLRRCAQDRPSPWHHPCPSVSSAPSRQEAARRAGTSRQSSRTCP